MAIILFLPKIQNVINIETNFKIRTEHLSFNP